MFDKVTIIGIGMIGSSVALSLRDNKLAKEVVIYDHNHDYLIEAESLRLGNVYEKDLEKSVVNSDVVIICTPVKTFYEITKVICPVMKKGAILTDVGSVKDEVIKQVLPNLHDGICFVPAHPVAGSEKSGPSAGFKEVFHGRWNIITPFDKATKESILKIRKMWEAFGMKVEEMTPLHHDRNMAIVSHLPHMLAYNMVFTASKLEDEFESEIIKYSAGGFRDSTRMAGSSPEMWRDIFLTNSKALFEIMESYINNLRYMQKLIEDKEADKLYDLFSETKEIRNQVIACKQN
ncbi:MAG: T-protein [Alphaproteobacteria bacterium ADurb.Bin438]|nr:MAG: T-protein [Alphaproteobacteria bacterium ADurb.Bin438]